MSRTGWLSIIGAALVGVGFLVQPLGLFASGAEAMQMGCWLGGVMILALAGENWVVGRGRPGSGVAPDAPLNGGIVLTLLLLFGLLLLAIWLITSLGGAGLVVVGVAVVVIVLLLPGAKFLSDIVDNVSRR